MDLIVTNVENFVYNVAVHSTAPLLITSDHFLITFDINSGVTHSVASLQTFWNYSRGDYIGLSTYLSDTDLNTLYQSEDVDHAWYVFH